jgi:hypothetical protein
MPFGRGRPHHRFRAGFERLQGFAAVFPGEGSSDLLLFNGRDMVIPRGGGESFGLVVKQQERVL